MKILNLDKNNIDLNKIKIAADYIKKNKLVVFPTETVYGLGANALNEKAVKKIFEAKNRPADNPLIIHISDLDQLEKIAEFSNDKNNVLIRKLINDFWPGPLTIIFKSKNNVPLVTRGGLDTVAVRMPNHPIALKLIELSNVPIAAPSANTSTKPSPTTAQHVIYDLKNKVDLIIEGGKCEIGLESTVINVVKGVINILRPGKISVENLKKYGKVIINNSKKISPGMKYKHYSPNSKVVLFEDLLKLEKYICINNINKFLIICDVEKKMILNRKFLNKNFKCLVYKNLNELAGKLFEWFRLSDIEKYDYIFCQKINSYDIGLAIMNRIEKAVDFEIK